MKNISTALLLCIAISPAFAISVCEADFTVETSGLTITVADASAAGAGDSILAWYYTIDGGISVNTPGFTYTFDSPGWHVICLMIETAGDCTDEKCEEVFIDADSTDCFVDFDYFTDGLTAEFVAETDPEEYLEITWYFGDGSTSTAPLPLHIYGAEGTYEVCVSVLFADSCSASVCYPVVIDTGEADCTASLEVWSADGLDIHFFGWVEPESDEVTYYFDYGDGISEVIEGGDSGADPWHSYAGEGMYVVCLSIETESGCTDTTCIELFVNDSTAMDCSASFDSETVGSIVFFLNQLQHPAPAMWNRISGNLAMALPPMAPTPTTSMSRVCISHALQLLLPPVVLPNTAQKSASAIPVLFASHFLPSPPLSRKPADGW